MTGREQNDADEGWAYGDVWKEGSPDDGRGAEGTAFVEVLRGDSGRGFDDTLMLDLIGFLGSRGVRATYDSFSLGLEPAAIKTYVLKVESGREAEAMDLLRERETGGAEP